MALQAHSVCVAVDPTRGGRHTECACYYEVKSTNNLGVIAFVLSSTSFLVFVFSSTERDLPARPGDGPDYDNIAVNLSAGNGFGLDAQNSEFLRPYKVANTDGRYDYLLARDGQFQLTANRPPGWPLTLVGVYRCFGRSFLAVRIVQVFFAALAIALAVALAGRIGGGVLAGMTLIFACFDSLFRGDATLQGYAMDVLTEPLAQLLLMVLIWALLFAVEAQKYWQALVAGAVFGLLVLVRAVFVLWLPFLTIALVVILIRRCTHESRTRSLQVAAVMVVGFAVTVGPWWARNCVVLGSFMPLGTHGWISMLGGYADEAIENHGNWSLEPILAFESEWKQQEAFQRTTDPLIRDRDFSIACKDRTIDWIKRNPGLVSRLAVLRLQTHWFPYVGKITVFSALSLFGLVVGLAIYRHEQAIQIMAVFVLIDALVIMVTYSTGGRFLVPLYPFLYIFAAIGIYGLAQRFTRRGASGAPPTTV